MILEQCIFPIPDTCFYLTSEKTDVYFSSWHRENQIEGHLKLASWFLHGSNMCDELGQISNTFPSVSVTRGVKRPNCVCHFVPLGHNLVSHKPNRTVMCQHKGIKPSHWIPIASSHAVQTRIWIVIYIKCQHPGSIWPLLSNLPLAQGRLALLTLAHWWTPKSAFMYLKAASLFWAEGSVSLLAAVSDGSSFCTPSPLLKSLHSKVKKDLQKHRSVWLPLELRGDMEAPQGAGHAAAPRWWRCTLV